MPFCVGGACYPEKHVEASGADVDLDNLVTKCAAGVDFLVSQLFFDNAEFFGRYAAMLGVELNDLFIDVIEGMKEVAADIGLEPGHPPSI